ncbi:MAG: phospho-N-acetylmuramoyl-pentapeptide-transferase [Elusimicrobia bacterium]|nr:phospho-N-acetylmuramoyl-pentapeptide-transferase [Elusimicrobiota bacterium]
MLYYLHLYKEYFSALNIFQYITFRAAGALVTSFLICMLLGPRLIAKLRSYKIQQVQRDCGPASHMSKHGTPTMGGLLILLSLVGSALLWTRPDSRFLWVLLWTTLTLAAVGIYDDYTKLVKKNPRGAPSWIKLAVQLFTAFAVATYLAYFPPNAHYATALSVPYTKQLVLQLSVWYAAVAMLVIVGSSNAVNLTDGLDGLAAGNIVFCALTYAGFAYLAGNAVFAGYLKLIPVEGAGEIAVFMGALVGAALGFMWYNCYPAQVFMGDTSSLFLGGVIGVAALCVKQELLLPLVGGVFVAETLSVILQIASFKLRGGKRIFRMAPLHHHFELSGWAEPKVTVRFWIAGIMLMLASLASLKIR